MPVTRLRRTSDTARLEAFSDAVFAIALTLLVLDLRAPSGPPGSFGASLLRNWEAYVAYLVAFGTISSIWLSHHNSFTRVAKVDAVVLALNLGVLLGASLLPWPTTLMAAAVERGDRADETAAIVVFAIVTLLIGGPWAILSAYLAKHPALLESDRDSAWMRRTAWRNVGSVVASGLGVTLGFVAPIVVLFVYLLVPVLFTIASLREREATA